MELGLLPSQFLSVVLEESDRNGGSSACTSNGLLQNLSTSALTISPVVPKPPLTLKKNVNGQYSSGSMRNGTSKVTNGFLYRNEYLDLKRRLPRTVLEECIVELADSSSKTCIKVPERPENAVIIKPMYAKKTEKSQLRNQKKEKIDFRDLFAKVEAVYSDDDESSMAAVSYAAPNGIKINGSSHHTDSNSSNSVADHAASLGYACDHCPNKYSNKGALWQHNVAAHSIEKSCECQLCGRKFYRNCSLALHMKCHSDEQNCSCKVCGKEFNRLSTLERHMKCHNAEAAAVAAAAASATTTSTNCTSNATSSGNVTSVSLNVTCAASATTASAIATTWSSSPISMSTTSASSFSAAAFSTFVCKICNKKCADEASFRAHLFSHNERFTCEQCNVTFNTKQLLDLHFHITHKRSETPFACKLCKARFANLRELNDHAMSHTYEKVRISCHHCGEVFTQRCSYKKHIQLHVGERLSCTICRIDFTQRSSLLRHYKRLHLINDIPHGGVGGAAVVETPNLTIITK